MVKTEQRTMKLGETSAFRYIGFQPPLTTEEVAKLPRPVMHTGTELSSVGCPSSVEIHDDESMDVGFSDTTFVVAELGLGGETFIEFAQRLAAHLGNCALDTEVRDVGPGSVIAQAGGVRPKW